MGIKSGLDQLSEMVLLVSQAESDVERTEQILAIQQEVRRLYGLGQELGRATTECLFAHAVNVSGTQGVR